MSTEIVEANQEQYRSLMPAGWIAVRKTCTNCGRLFITGRPPDREAQDRCAFCFDEKEPAP